MLRKSLLRLSPTTVDLAALRQSTRAALGAKVTSYSPAVLDAEVARYFTDLGLDPTYFRLNTADEIAHHIQGFIAAQRMATLSNIQSSADLFFRVQRESNVVFFCADTEPLIRKVETEIQREILGKSNKDGYSIRCYKSTAPFREGATAGLCVYEVQWSSYPEGTKPAEIEYENKPKDFRLMCTKEFGRQRPKEVVDRYNEVVAELCEKKRLVPVTRLIDKSQTASNQNVLVVAFGTKSPNYLQGISQLANTYGINIVRKYVETFDYNSIEVFSIYIDDATPAEKLKLFEKEVALLSLVPSSLHERLIRAYREHTIDTKTLLYLHSVSTFAFFFTENVSEENLYLKTALAKDERNLARLHRMSEQLWREAITLNRIVRLATDHLPLMKMLYEDFAHKTNTPGAPRAVPESIREAIASTVTDPLENVIFESFVTFNESVVKTNFHKNSKAALSYRIDTSFMGRIGYTEVPFGLFLFVGSNFTGFHIRFRDIARGGVRLVSPMNWQAHKAAFKRLIQENLNLALTQQRKNKDIPEGGSKGVLVVDPGATQPQRQSTYLQYVDALVDLIIPNVDGVVDRHGIPEIIFLGPDENTGNYDFPDKAMEHAGQRGYKHDKSFTTGKSPHNGGVPHDMYGMTTTGVCEFKKCLREVFNLDETKVIKVQTAGPNGDLGGNEIKMSCDITTTIVDVDAVLYDPTGLDRDELMRLVNNRLSARHFNPSKIKSAEGFVVSAEDAGKKLPDGQVVENFNSFRDTFMFTQKADFFVPCGGRPRAIDIHSVHRMLVKPGDLTGDIMLQTKSTDLNNLRYKYIVEGANLFITPEARVALENYGCILYPDASANKGGVTSSSYEVLSALALSREEHAKFMLVPRSDTFSPSPFFLKYVDGIHTIIKRNCRREFECIESEYKRLNGTLPRSRISDRISHRINKINAKALNSGLGKDVYLREKVLRKALPPVLLTEVPLEKVMQRVPEPYQVAIFNAYVSSNYVYSVGLQENETAFTRFMKTLA